MQARKISVFFVLAFFLAFAPGAGAQDSPATPDPLPGPQLVVGADMFIAAYKADPEVLKSLLPPGLKPHPNNHVVINMYTVPDPYQTSGFGAYTLTYLTVEIDGDDSYVMGAPEVTYPGRYFVHYFNSSPKMRKFALAAGIPATATDGVTTTEVKKGVLTAKLDVGGKTLIESTAKVAKEYGPLGGGHLNYFGFLKGKKKVVKYPIPWNGKAVVAEGAKIKFNVPKDHPLAKLIPLSDPTWAVWMNGSFVYPQYQIVN